MVRNSMEEKQLDFNAPLLSVRRFSSKVASLEGDKSKKIQSSYSNSQVPSLPFYKSDLKSGPIRNAGEVPFVWEQIPGRPKDEDGSTIPTFGQPPSTPKLPPGRTSEVSPGRTSEVSRLSSEELEKKAEIKPQIGNVSNDVKNPSLEVNGTKMENKKEGVKEEEAEEEDSSSEEEGNDAYADALDTLSRTESFFYNCSVNGVSGLDGSEVKPSGVFVGDPKTRDLMMDRFLPAAKAMASEAPHYAPRTRRQPVVREQLSQVKKIVKWDKMSTLYQYKPDIVPYTGDPEEDDESEDEDDDYNHTGHLSTKACGLLPRFCLKNSLCLLNLVPGMKVRSHSPLPPVRKFTHVKTAGARTATKDERNWEAVYKHKLMNGLQQLDVESKLISESNQLTSSSDSKTPDESSPNMHAGGGGISPYRNNMPQSPFHEGTGFLGTPKQVKSLKSNGFYPYKNSHIDFQETLSHLSGRRGSGPLSFTDEKTLYVDSIHEQKSNSDSSPTESNSLIGYSEKDPERLTENHGVIKDAFVDVSQLEDTKYLNVSKARGALQPKASKVFTTDSQSSSNRSIPEGAVDNIEVFTKDGGFNDNSRSLVCLEVANIEGLGVYKSHTSATYDQRISIFSSSESPLAPPLPNSPSESWLWRTLPSISSRNSMQLQHGKQSTKTPPVNPKWETIVKTSNAHHDHLRFSEELTTPLSQQSEA